MGTPVKISAAIITFNEEKNIRRCLESLIDVVDEIVVVDSFSTDRTKDICEELGARFIQNKFEGHIEQKNFAKDQALYDYVLSLDADEALSDRLKAEVQRVKENWESDGYTMNRLSNYCGKWIKHCGWYPDKKLRLFNRSKGQWGGVNPHDKFELNGASDHLKGDLLHYTYYTVEEHQAQVEKFTEIAARAQISKGNKGSNFFMVWIYPGLRFLQSYIFRLGFLDGYFGYKICTISAYATHLKYARIRRYKREG